MFNLITFIFLSSLLISSNTYANQVQFQSFSLGALNNVDIILSANPPLPFTDYKPGNYKLTLQPTYYKGTNNFSLNENEFDGYGLAFSYTKIFSENMGWYLGGSFLSYSANHNVNLFLADINLSNVDGKFFTMTGGVHYHLLTQDGAIPDVVGLFGTYVKATRFSQTFFQRGGLLDNGTRSTAVLLDFDMESNPILYGLQLGGKTSWKIINEKFSVNLFGFLLVPLSSECQKYKVTAVRTDVEGDAALGRCTNGDQGIDFYSSKVSGGFSIGYVPWDISLNVSAPIIKAIVEDYNDQDTTIISFSKSFGN